MSRWMRRGAMVIAALVVTAAVTACSDDDAETTPSSTVATTTTSIAPSTSTTTTTTTVPASTTTTESSSTVPQATEPPPPSDPVTATSLPEGVPPRVTFPDDPDKQAVVDAAYAFFDAARDAQAAPGDESLRIALAETMTDPIAERMLAFLDRLLERGERVRQGSENPTYLEIFESTVFAIDGSAIFDGCGVDGDVRVSGPPENEVVLDADPVSGLQTYSLDWDGERWRVQDFSTSARFEGQLGCG